MSLGRSQTAQASEHSAQASLQRQVALPDQHNRRASAFQRSSWHIPARKKRQAKKARNRHHENACPSILFMSAKWKFMHKILPPGLAECALGKHDLGRVSEAVILQALQVDPSFEPLEATAWSSGRPRSGRPSEIRQRLLSRTLSSSFTPGKSSTSWVGKARGRPRPCAAVATQMKRSRASLHLGRCSYLMSKTDSVLEPAEEEEPAGGISANTKCKCFCGQALWR